MIVWYENDGSGGGWTAHTLDASYAAQALVAADFDDDGDMDVVASDDTDVAWWIDGPSASNVTVYGYSPSGLRVSQVTNGVTKTWSYQGTAIASEHSSDASDVHQVYTVLGGVALERHDVDTVADETDSRATTPTTTAATWWPSPTTQAPSSTPTTTAPTAKSSRPTTAPAAPPPPTTST